MEFDTEKLEPTLDEHNPNSAFDKDSYRKVMQLAKEHSDPRVYDIFKMRYEIGSKNKVMPWQRIAEHLKMSIQGCINIHNSAINKFRQKLIKE